MKLPRNSLIWCVLIVCLTLLIFTYLTGNVTLRANSGAKRGL
ncbi:Hok/Gef family protein [Salmonella enterica]|nr:Hok/Gef family protein [Salmonella enterica]